MWDVRELTDLSERPLDSKFYSEESAKCFLQKTTAFLAD
jgi:hypothetical protein